MTIDLSALGLGGLKTVHHNLSTPQLIEASLRRGEKSALGSDGQLVVNTGVHTGRSPKDKFIVDGPETRDNVDWGKVNQPLSREHADRLYAKLVDHLKSQGEAFVLDCVAGADPKYRIPVRVVTEYAWHSLFAKNLFIEPEDGNLQGALPGFTVIDCPSVKADPATDGTKSETFVVVDFANHRVLIGGTEYAGEIKKSIFTILNYLLPLQGVMSMHCSANVGPKGDVAILFGLSGTGKTTLSADPERPLIGDDEHGWSPTGVFNYEGGCYAKAIRLNQKSEPEIWDATHSFGTVLENVVMDPETRALDLDSDALTENTRSAYSIDRLKNIVPEGRAGHPTNIVMLTADAFGVLPPLAKLTPEQAMYHFLSGYTAKVAGTEKGVKEPQATFSTCFGAPFMVLHPTKYADLLGKLMNEHKVNCWLVNTGWSGGPYGTGSRMAIAHTRALIHAALSGRLDDAAYETDPNFGVGVPTSCPGVPADVLKPRNTWADGAAYDRQAAKLAGLFVENFKAFEGKVAPAIASAGPTLKTPVA